MFYFLYPGLSYYMHDDMRSVQLKRSEILNTHGIRLKSIKSRSEVVVKILVYPVCFVFCLDFHLLVCKAERSPTSISSSKEIGLAPE